LEGNTRISLQTRELVTPAEDSNWREFAGLRAGAPISRSASSVGSSQRADQEIGAPWFNRLIYGDNLLAMAALLAGDEHTPSLRGKIDLFYIDPPFDSKADYRTKITLPGGDVEQKPTVVEQFAYSDTWADGTASYLAMIVPHLCLMRELLSDRGSIYVQVDWHVGHYVKIVLDEVFGKELFQNEIIWKRSLPHNDPKRYGSIHDTIFFYLKSEDFTFNQQYTPLNDSYIASHYNRSGTKISTNFACGHGTRPRAKFRWESARAARWKSLALYAKEH
jgi:adenine-specific DNA-methyltransferase